MVMLTAIRVTHGGEGRVGKKKKNPEKRPSGAGVTKGDVRKSPVKKTEKTEPEISPFLPHRKRVAGPSGCVVLGKIDS